MVSCLYFTFYWIRCPTPQCESYALRSRLQVSSEGRTTRMSKKFLDTREAAFASRTRLVATARAFRFAIFAAVLQLRGMSSMSSMLSFSVCVMLCHSELRTPGMAFSPLAIDLKNDITDCCILLSLSSRQLFKSQAGTYVVHRGRSPLICARPTPRA